MCNFSVQGDDWRDYFLVNTHRDFAVLPALTIREIPYDVPVRLQVGNLSWGMDHIRHKHAHWVNSTGMTVPELVYHKLGQSGTIFSSELSDKYKIDLRISPDALMVLRLIRNFQQDFFTVVTLYKHQGHLDGIRLGRYEHHFRC